MHTKAKLAKMTMAELRALPEYKTRSVEAIKKHFGGKTLSALKHEELV